MRFFSCISFQKGSSCLAEIDGDRIDVNLPGFVPAFANLPPHRFSAGTDSIGFEPHSGTVPLGRSGMNGELQTSCGLPALTEDGRNLSVDFNHPKFTALFQKR